MAATDVYAEAWLQVRGFDPAGDLRAPISVKRKPGMSATAMYEACHAGDLGMCMWLSYRGAGDTIKVANNMKVTPFMAACREGHFSVLRWLFNQGAQEDVKLKRKDGYLSPMELSCQ